MEFPNIKLKPREYQKNIVHSCIKKGNTLVVLPTGLGKTLIGLMLIDYFSKKGKCIFLAPTRPLVKQHVESIKKKTRFDEESIAFITGEINPKKRIELWKKRICCSTPQTLKNDIEKNRASLDSVSLCIFDEAHRTIGKYAYTYIAKECKKNNVNMVALTASPGSASKKINEIMQTLLIKNIESRSYEDADVKPYMHNIKMNYKYVELNEEIKQARDLIRKEIEKRRDLLVKMGIRPNIRSKKRFLAIRVEILKKGGWTRYKGLSEYSALLNLLHLEELLETQGLYTSKKFIERLEEDARTKAKKSIISSQNYQKAKYIIEKNLEKGNEHVKMKELLKICKKDKTYIIFSQYRDQVFAITKILNENGFKAKEFLGKKKGYNKKQQEKTLEEFRNKEFNILVASSIGEEGLDIPQVDVVIFYEPIPSEIRAIQRMGRTGRSKDGEVYILITKKTRDETFFWVEKKREKKMKKTIEKMSGKKINVKKKIKKQTNLSDYF